MAYLRLCVGVVQIGGMCVCVYTNSTSVRVCVCLCVSSSFVMIPYTPNQPVRVCVCVQGRAAQCSHIGEVSEVSALCGHLVIK